MSRSREPTDADYEDYKEFYEKVKTKRERAQRTKRATWWTKVALGALIMTLVAAMFCPINLPTDRVPGTIYRGFPYYFASFSMLEPPSFYLMPFFVDYAIWLAFSYVFAKRAWLVKTTLTEPERYI